MDTERELRRLAPGSGGPDEALGRLLVAQGLLGEEELASSLAMARGRGEACRLVEVLVERGLVDVPTVQRVVLEASDGPTLSDPTHRRPSGEVSAARFARPAPASDSGDLHREMPATIGRYRVLSELGRGGMGVVYEGHDPELDRPVAIKMIRDLDGDEDELERFVREARAGAKLAHPGIVSVYDVGRHQGRPYIAMDCVEGEGLDVLLRREKLAPRRVAELLSQVARALHHAHERGIIHRDVKPQNIIIDAATGRPRVTDFGLARVAGGRDLTLSGEAVGTPAYMAPEQARSERESQGPWSDVWSLGVILYRALARRLPFDGPNALAIMSAAAEDDPEPPSLVTASTHPDLETIALRCLEKEPDRRYRSAAEVADELDRFGRGEAILARPPGAAGRVRRWARRHRLLAALLVLFGLGVVALLVGGGVAIDRARDAARAEIVEDARARAWKDLAAFRALTDDARAATSTDQVIGAGLAALQATDRLAALEPEDESARRDLVETALLLAAIATEAEQWSVALAAVDRARAAGSDPGPAEAAARALEDARARRLDEVRVTLAAAADDELPTGGIAYERALFGIVRRGDEATVALLVERLAELTSRLRRVTRETLVAAAKDAPAELIAARLDGAGAADTFDAFHDAPTTEPASVALTRAHDGLLIALGAGQANNPAAAAEQGLRSLGRRILARTQTDALGANDALVARLCCESLGWIGARDARTLAALGRYLRLETNVTRASFAAQALALAGTELSERTLTVCSAGFGASRALWRRIRPILSLRPGEGGTPEGAVQPEEAPPDDLEALLDLAERRGAAGEHASAIETFEQAIELAPDDFRGWLGRGRARAYLGRIDDALLDLDEAVSRSPESSVAALILRAEIRRRAGRTREALGDADAATDRQPRVAETWLVRSRIQLACGDPAAAEADLDRALAIEPDAPQLLRERSRIRRARGRSDAALDDAERAVAVAPRDASSHLELARVLVARGALDEAMTALGRALSLSPEDPALLAERAAVHVRLRDGRAALADYDRAVQLAPRNAQLRCDRGVLRRRVGDPEGAVEDYTAALEADPTHLQSYNARGNALRELGRLDEALRDLDRAAELGRDKPTIFNNRGLLRRDMDDRRGAIEDFTRAIELLDSWAEPWGNRSLCRSDLGDTDGALTDADRAIELAPTSSSGWSYRAFALYAAEEFARAIADASRAIELDQSDTEAWYVRARCRLVLGDRAGAIADLRAARARAASADAAAKYIRDLEAIGAGD